MLSRSVSPFPGVMRLAAIALLFPSFSALAAGDADLAAIRAQLAEMKAAYEQRIAALESRLAQAETAVRQTSPAPQAQAPAPSAPSRLAQAAASAFNPEISLILDAKYAQTSRNPATYRIQGFIPNGGEIAPPNRSFSLGETELAFSANVDHLFRGNVRLAVAGEEGGGINAEEANVETLGLPQGFKLKAGRYLSGIGYLNQQHPHEWDFVDAPLVYKAFYGSRLSNDGVQLKWLAPAPLFVEFGAEVAHGGGYPGTDRAKNGSGLGTLFVHVGDDLGDSHAWQAGLSHVRTAARDRTWEDSDAAGIATSNAFTGSSRTWGADLIWKWAPQGNPTHTNFKFQTEVFQRKESGLVSCADAGATPSACTAGPSGDYARRQQGAYAQAVWQFMPQWRVGARYDRLQAGNVSLGAGLNPADLPVLGRFDPRRQTVMVDWSPSEFSRIRVQFARDESRGPGQTDSQFFVQYLMSLGAHGAHKF